MATSGALNTSNTYIKYKITITQNSQSVTNNSSNVTVSVKFYRTNTGYTTYGTGTVYCKINGTTYTASVTPSHKITNSGIVLFTKTLDIPHSSDGTKTLTCSAWISHERVTSSEQSYSLTLTAIARASTFTRSGTAQLGKEQTITVTRKNTSYTHTLTFTFAKVEYYIVTKVTDSTIKWTPPLTLANDMPNVTSGTGTLTLTTYNSSGAKIGKNTLSFTFSIPDTVVPSISKVTLTEAADAVKNLNLGTNTFLNTLSKIKYAITAAGAYGSTIKTYSLILAGVSFSGSTGTTTAINRPADEYETTVTVTDSRGRKATTTVKYKVVDYTPPQITELTAERDEDDDANTNIAFDVKVSSVEKLNLYSIDMSYRQVGATEYTTLYSPIPTDIEYSYKETLSTFSPDNAYEIKVTVTDKFNTVSRIVEVPTGTPVFDIFSDGSGMGFYMVANRNEYGFRKPVAFYGGWKAKEIEATAEKPVDIDTILQAGIYHCSDTTYLSNRPYISTANITASLMVLECGNAGQLAQIYTVCQKTGNLEYRRFRFYDSWGEWYRTSGEVILWSGAWYMHGNQQIELTGENAISRQPNGIKLVFSRYYNGEVLDQQMQTFVVSKTEIAETQDEATDGTLTGAGHSFLLTSAGNFTLMACKYLYITDTSIKGNAVNDDGATQGACGVTYTNDAYVLRYVIGY